MRMASRLLSSLCCAVHLRPRAPPARLLCGVPSNRITDALLLSFDVETTDVDVAKDRVVELGATYHTVLERAGPRRRMLVNPGVPIPSAAAEVHGISDADVETAPDFGTVGSAFVRHLLHGPDGPDSASAAPPVLCGYNALAYDVPLLNAEFARAGIQHRIDPATVLDPIHFVRWYHRAWPKRTLSAAAAACGHDLADAHSAAADAEATGAVLCGLIADGTVPDDRDSAFAAQARLGGRLAAELATFSHFLYVRRDAPLWAEFDAAPPAAGQAAVPAPPDGEGLNPLLQCVAVSDLRLGFGKHVGTPLAEAEPAYLKWCLEKMPLPWFAQEALERAISERGA